MMIIALIDKALRPFLSLEKIIAPSYIDVITDALSNEIAPPVKIVYPQIETIIMSDRNFLKYK